MAFETGERLSDRGPVPVRLRAGTAGESVRVVHTGVELPSGDFYTACQRTLGTAITEVVEPGGMPCIQCVARLSSSAGSCFSKLAR